MKKLVFFILTISTFTSVAFANPIAPGEFGGTIFNSLLYKIGLVPTIGIEIIFLLIMFGLAICLSYKSLDVKNKPENKDSFIGIATVIVVLTILTGVILVNETISANSFNGNPFEIQL